MSENEQSPTLSIDGSGNRPRSGFTFKPFNIGENPNISINEIVYRDDDENSKKLEKIPTKRIKSISPIKIKSPEQQNQIVEITHPKEEIKELRQNHTRFTGSFFQRKCQMRTGFPTLNGKGRKMMDIWNWDNMDFMEDEKNNHNKENSQPDNNKINAPLMIEMEKIEKQTALKTKMETFVLYFNNNFEEGINYIIKSNIIDEKPNKIAYLMLAIEGLSKEMIGKCLGSHKEKNIAILQAYCELFDFRGLEFDHALRLFLSTFKLPGEAQQIERIVRIFASVYQKDNPTEFDDPEIPSILAYSILMLNTDAHNDLIPMKNKMTKQQFVNNNIRICPSIPKSYLERMYDNIVKEKFETKIDYIESVYNRLHKGKFDLQGESLKNAMSLASELSTGCNFMKYGRKGSPHLRFVWISELENMVYWRDEKKMREKARSIHFNEIYDVLVGCNTTSVLLRHSIPPEHDPLFFSLITPTRTLDLKAPSVEIRIKWEQYFRLLLANKKLNFPYKNQNNQQLKKDKKERLSEIWKTEILANWEFYWDYDSGRPKGTKILIKHKSSPKKKRINTQGSSFICGASKAKKQAINLSQIEDKIHEINTGESSYKDTSNDYYKEILKNKNTLLISLWGNGIPDWLKKTLWPIMIENRLEITPSLYELLVEKSKKVENDDSKNSFKRIHVDLDINFSSIEILQDESKINSLTNILKAFVIYRPDIGYSKGMSNLAAVLLVYLTEYEAFKCFINLTHSHFFLSFFRGDLREIEWRIKFFDQEFKKELPFLYNHFKALDLSSDMYLLEWNLTDIEIISRIWDCFFLDGELFAIKTGIGLLKFFQTELRMLTFDGAIKFLKKLPNNIDENVFFEVINSINISEFDHEKVIQAQKIAKTNTQIHQALLI